MQLIPVTASHVPSRRALICLAHSIAIHYLHHPILVKVISNRKCERSNSDGMNYRGHIHKNMLCAEADLKDSCQVNYPSIFCINLLESY